MPTQTSRLCRLTLFCQNLAETFQAIGQISKIQTESLLRLSLLKYLKIEDSNLYTRKIWGEKSPLIISSVYLAMF